MDDDGESTWVIGRGNTLESARAMRAGRERPLSHGWAFRSPVGRRLITGSSSVRCGAHGGVRTHTGRVPRGTSARPEGSTWNIAGASLSWGSLGLHRAIAHSHQPAGVDSEALLRVGSMKAATQACATAGER